MSPSELSEVSLPSPARGPKAQLDNTMAVAHATRQSGQKLFGRAFYESIGSPKLVLAPMVDHSEAAWRILTRSFLPECSKGLLAYTPMMHSRLFSNTPKYRAQNFEPFPHVPGQPLEDYFNTPYSSPNHYLDGHPVHDRPLVVQFCSNTPDDLLAAARLVEPYCDAVDLNLGCPQGIARRGYYGSFLQEDWGLIYKLINKLHEELSIPVTAKMRILETKEKTLEYAKMILSAGASIITVHGRQRDQKGHYTGLADWTVLRYLREHLPPETVIFANGNVLRHEDLWRCLEATGADGIMSAEGNLADPTIFADPPTPGQEGREYWRGKDGRGGFRMDAVLRRYMDIIYRHVLHHDPPTRKPLFLPSDLSVEDEASHFLDPVLYARSLPKPDEQLSAIKKKDEYVSINLRVMQSHMFHLLRPLVAKRTEIRNALARSRVGDIAAFETVLQMVEDAVKEGILEQADEAQTMTTQETQANVDAVPDDEVTASSSDAAIRRCKRPWFICQPYVRPLPEEAIKKGAITLSKKQQDARQAVGAAIERAAGLTHGGTLVDGPLGGRLEQKVTVREEGMVSG